MEERETFEERLGPALDALFDGARLLMGDADRAEELVLAVVLDAWRRYARPEVPPDFRRWIVGALVRRYLEQADDDADMGRGEGPGTGAAPTPEPPEERTLGTLVADLAALERTDPARLGENIRRSLRALPGRERLSVWLVDVMGFSYGEAGGAMGLDSGDFRRILYRARRDLQHRLGPAVRADVERGRAASRRGEEA